MTDSGNTTRFAGYLHQPRAVEPAGVLAASGLTLKVYDMFIPGKPGNPVNEASAFLEQECVSGRLPPLSGLGFTIVSKDMINVVRWDGRCPIVMNNQIYEYDSKNLIETAKKLDVNECGSFCIWEAGIVNFEKDAWTDYLASRRTEEDEKEYLHSFLRGSLNPPIA